MYKVLSLGWGVQSFTIAAMSALGELEHIDLAIHADTTHEMSYTYKHAKKYTPWLIEHGINVITVTPKLPNVIMYKLNGNSYVSIPAYTKSQSKTGGQIRRQCTEHWKIRPMRRYIREYIGGKKSYEFWLGISTDEIIRIKESDVKYITNRWPLIERNMSRTDCINWLMAHNLDVPGKSSCTFCPFKTQDVWRKMQNEKSVDWQSAITVDENIRQASPPYELFLHQKQIPLEQINFGNIDTHKQLNLFTEECSGICGV